MTLVQNKEVEVAVELVTDEMKCQRIVAHSRAELMELTIELFPEHEQAIRNEFAAIERQCKAAAVTHAQLQREFFESRWV